MVTSPSKSMGRDFTYQGWSFDPDNGHLQCHYANPEFGDFTESFFFAGIDASRYMLIKEAADAAMACLYWMAGVSYYKTTLASHIEFTDRKPSTSQAQWLTQTWQAGLAELAVENQLPWLDHIQVNGQDQPITTSKHLQLKPRSLVAIGGGKDSLVSIEAIKAMDEPASLLQVGQSEFIQHVAEHTGLPLIQIRRQVDPKLKQVNAAGAFNGHVPITAINACVGVVAALLFDFDSVVFSNERSADVGNFKTAEGHWVNHQHSKSLAYETMWQNIIRQHIAKDLDCFSLLRPYSELAIVKKFAKLKPYFPHFSSCNRNFHLTGSQNTQHHWCGQCPKCAFVFLTLAPFISHSELLAIFHKDLFANDALVPLFESLLGIDGVKPFECVGEVQECRLALQYLSEHPEWQDHDRVQAWLRQLADQDDIDPNAVMRPSSEHIIPAKRRFQEVLLHAD